MSAINFVVRDGAGNISRGSVAGEGAPSSVVVGAGADVSLNLNQGQIISYVRQGQALEITLVDGRVIVIEGYFTMEGVAENQLFLSADGFLTEVQLTQGAGADYYARYTPGDQMGKYAGSDDLYFMRSADAMLAAEYVPQDDEVGMLAGALGGIAPMLGWGGAAAAGAAVIATTGGGGGSTPAPEVAVLTGTEGGDQHVVNQEDHSDGVDIGGEGTPGATVDVTIGDVTETTIVGEDGGWSVTFAPEDVETGEYSADVTVTATNEGGSVTVTDTLIVDTVIGVEMDATGGSDGVINAVEFEGGTTFSGTVTGGDTVIVTIGGVEYAAVVSGTSWSLDVGSDILGDGERSVDVTVTATDAVGNSSSTTQTVIVDTYVNELTVTEHAGGADRTVNFDESGQTITMSGTVEAGSTVVVNLHGVEMNATVAADGSWTVSYAAGTLPAGEYETSVTVTATDAAGNSSSLTEAVTVDTVAGDLALSTLPIEIDDVVNAVEHSDGVIISGTATPGLTVTVGLGSATLDVVAGGDGTWSVNFPASMVPEGTYEAAITASITDAVGNYKEVSDTVQIDTEVVPFNFSTSPVEGDDVINGAEAADGVVLSGQVEPGSTVVVEFGGQSVNATVSASGAWSANFPASAVSGGEYMASMTATATDAAGNVSVITDSVEVDTLVNRLTSDDPVEGDNIVNAAELSDGVTLTGTVEAGSTVMITFQHSGGTITREATVDAAGNWSVSYSALEIPGGEYDANITIAATDMHGNTDSITDTFRVDTVIPEAPAVESVTLTDAGVEYLGIDSTTNDVTVSEISEAGAVTELANQDDGAALPWGETLFNFDPALSDGSHLVVNEMDAAGNEMATYVAMEEAGTNAIDLSGLDGFEIGAIDLSFAKDSELTIDLSTLEGLADQENSLTIHGGSDDAVTLTGAANSGVSTTIDGKSYDIYTMGDDAQILVEEDINVTI